MLSTLINVNFIVGLFMTLAYLYQIVYAGVGLLCRRVKPEPKPKKLHRFATLICARNEEDVIGELVASLKNQNYPAELLDIYVLADNCTDDTGGRAEEAGAIVYRRFSTVKVGKGYAMDYMLKRIDERCGIGAYDGYFVFDADNVVDENFVCEMNKTFDRGYKVITSYRNSKNFASNWISASYSIWFLREARFLNYPRMLMKTGCAVSGTGFCVASEVIEKNGGWPFHLMTEDIEFSVDCAIKGIKIGYSDKAMIYDEQPTTFKQSWNQRLRWSKGFYQVDAKYMLPLVKGMFGSKGRRSTCYDMFMTVAPGMMFTLLAMIFNIFICFACLSQPLNNAELILMCASKYLVYAMLSFYVMLLAYGTLTVISEWKLIRATGAQKLKYLLVFPIFMATYIPISLVALMKRVEWKPIQHFATGTANAGGLKRN